MSIKEQVLKICNSVDVAFPYGMYILVYIHFYMSPIFKSSAVFHGMYYILIYLCSIQLVASQLSESAEDTKNDIHREYTKKKLSFA